MFKGKNDLSPVITKKVFELKETSYNLRLQGNYFACRNVKTTHCGIQSIKYLAPKMWEVVPDQTKHCGPLTKFKNIFKSWNQVAALVSSRLHLTRHNNEIR